MGNKILMPQLISMLAAATGKPKKQAEAYLKAYFAGLSEALEKHDTVKIKDFGNFKVTRVEARKSVNVSSGEEVKIPSHYKVVFTPAKAMADAVNKEFAWLENVELEDSPSEVTDTHDVEEGKTVSSIAAAREEELTHKQEQQSERLGEELERDFGIPEPSDPFGPAEPDDDGMIEPEEKTDTTVESSNEIHVVDNESLKSQEKQLEIPVPNGIQPGNATVKPRKDFDPYALEIPREIQEESPKEPYSLTKEEFEGLATKSDMRIVVKNIKRIRSNVDNLEEESKERSRKSLLWALIFCTILMTGGFFLTYFLITTRLAITDSRQSPVEELNETEIENDEEFAPTTVNGMGFEDIEVQDTDTAQNHIVSYMSGNGASPSEIIAMDKVTNTRYLTTMAKEHYGNYNFWPYIYIENEGKLGHPDRIKPGTTVVIPNIEKFDIDPTNPRDIEKARRLGVEIYKKYASN